MLGFKLNGGRGGTSRKDWSQLRWVPSMSDKGGVNSGPGFSLCAVPLESFGPVFQDRRGDGMNEWRSGVYRTRVGGGGYSEGRS